MYTVVCITKTNLSEDTDLANIRWQKIPYGGELEKNMREGVTIMTDFTIRSKTTDLGRNT